MDWNIGYTLWMFFAAFLTGWNLVAVLFQKKRYNYKIALFSVGFFCARYWNEKSLNEITGDFFSVI